MPNIPESEVVKAVLACFNDSDGIALWRRNVLAVKRVDAHGKQYLLRNGDAGQADLYGIVRTTCPQCGITRTGVHCEIELKGSDGKVSDLQAQWISHCQKLDAVAFILRVSNDAELLNIRRIILDKINCVCPACLDKEQGGSQETSNAPVGTLKMTSVEDYQKALSAMQKNKRNKYR